LGGSGVGGRKKRGKHQLLKMGSATEVEKAYENGKRR